MRNGPSLFLSSRQLTAEVRSTGTGEDCDLAMHAQAAEALRSPSADRPRLQRGGDDGDLCCATLDAEGQVELEVLPAGQESPGGVPRENAALDRKRAAETEVSKSSGHLCFFGSTPNVCLPVKLDRSPSVRETSLIQPVSAMERERTMRNLVDTQRKVEWKQQRGRERQLLRVR